MDSAFTDLENSAASLPHHSPQPCNSMAIALEPDSENYEVLIFKVLSLVHMLSMWFDLIIFPIYVGIPTAD